MNEKSTFIPIGPTTFMAPIPSILVGCYEPTIHEKPNLITIAWTGIINTHPPMLSISVRQNRLSHRIIKKSGEFTVNFVDESLCKAMDFCGVKSGKNVDKFKELNLTPINASPLQHAKAVAESPAFLSCKVSDIISLGSHDLFLANIVQVHIAEKYYLKNGAIDTVSMNLVSFGHGKYQSMSDMLGFFGYSIASKKVLERRMPATKKEK